jgi:hypothetical protein
MKSIEQQISDLRLYLEQGTPDFFDDYIDLINQCPNWKITKNSYGLYTVVKKTDKDYDHRLFSYDLFFITIYLNQHGLLMDLACLLKTSKNTSVDIELFDD